MLIAFLVPLSGKATAQVGEIGVRGKNGVRISAGDLQPAVADGTFLGVVTLGEEQSLSSTFTVENTGTGNFSFVALTGTPPVTVGGEHPDDFQITQPDSTFLIAGGSTTFVVTLTPTAGRIRNGASRSVVDRR